MPLKEKIIEIKKGSGNKKYKVLVMNRKTGNTRTIQFGDKRYGQYKDKTKLKLYSYLDHNDLRRRKLYYLRHSGTENRREAIKKEEIKSGFLYTPKILSHKFLW